MPRVGKSNASECARNALFWRETEPVEGTDEGDVEVAREAEGFGGIALAEMSISNVAPKVAPAAASGPGEVAEMLRLSAAG
jgi:hypothetical protein